MEFVEIDKNQFENLFNYKVENTLIYTLKDEKIVGYGFIKNDEDNQLNIHVLEKYRGNGYGTILFKNLLNVIDDKKEINLTVSKENIPINRIIKSSGGILVFEGSKCSNYIIPLKNK